MSVLITIVDAMHDAGSCYLALFCLRHILRSVLGERVAP
jgi:hypothetical protein